ncbi:hypothetical protein BDK51DRAFT_49766 [Blyttiomyces helicus]|uniref:Uncharacterized protein n=1 Tax=Blyttiomyces helicus TaxID=388810 RepID=A0A4P9VWU6_9FUNG|nr:hypothetical protein BDK51DRAFT_49766 [Blyttiomyces helicus]|eukprot:RKO83672.1 hypothetical protein BDK51DRAFT_49766 [Blyttiomyces helicus]
MSATILRTHTTASSSSSCSRRRRITCSCVVRTGGKGRERTCSKDYGKHEGSSIVLRSAHAYLTRVETGGNGVNGRLSPSRRGSDSSLRRSPAPPARDGNGQEDAGQLPLGLRRTEEHCQFPGSRKRSPEQNDQVGPSQRLAIRVGATRGIAAGGRCSTRAVLTRSNMRNTLQKGRHPELENSSAPILSTSSRTNPPHRGGQSAAPGCARALTTRSTPRARGPVRHTLDLLASAWALPRRVHPQRDVLVLRRQANGGVV